MWGSGLGVKGLGFSIWGLGCTEEIVCHFVHRNPETIAHTLTDPRIPSMI